MSTARVQALWFVTRTCRGEALVTSLSDRTKIFVESFVESSGCRTRPLKIREYRPRLTCQWYTSGMDVSSESMVLMKQATGYGVENPHARSFLGGEESLVSRLESETTLVRRLTLRSSSNSTGMP